MPILNPHLASPPLCLCLYPSISTALPAFQHRNFPDCCCSKKDSPWGMEASVIISALKGGNHMLKEQKKTHKNKTHVDTE